MKVATVTDRHVTVTSNFASVTVAEPCSVRTYELTVTYRHDNPNFYAGAHTRAHRSNPGCNGYRRDGV
jgi:hypothetical protein